MFRVSRSVLRVSRSVLRVSRPVFRVQRGSHMQEEDSKDFY